jgi:hydroxymethylglutaryl-CoA lyase
MRIHVAGRSLFGSILDAARTIARLPLSRHLRDGDGELLRRIEAGVTAFEAAFGGLGGCPFTALSGGNVATEDLVHMLQSAGLRHDIAIDRIISVAKDAEDFFRRELPGVIHRTGVIPTTAAPVLSS